MKPVLLCLPLLLGLGTHRVCALTDTPPLARLRPVPLSQVRIEDEFWAPKIKLVREVTLPHNFEQCEQTGRLRNFDKAAGKISGAFEGFFFNDSDVYKVIEGAAYALMQERDAKLEQYVDEQIARIAAAQQKDGYLNSYYSLSTSEERWSNLADKHELYCAGHLIEAAVAYYQATGKRTLLDAALRLFDHIDSIFGPGKRLDVCGHPEIELALFKLYRLSGDERHRKLAEFFIEQRGNPDRPQRYGDYCQDHMPLREQTQVVGHAVRAMYLYSGVTDLVGLNGDAGLAAMLDRVWNDLVSTKMYITGGIGPSARNEGFTTGYDLPNDTAYAETCAAIGLALWNSRLSLLHGDARYVDVLERAAYNGVLSGLSLDGKNFFYVNPLSSRGNHHRQPWFECACCPPNLARFIPSIGGYAYAQTDDAIYVNLYIASAAKVKLGKESSGDELTIKQETRYPWEGAVKITLSPAAPREFELNLRIPGWCRNAGLKVAGQTIEPLELHNGYARVRRTWKAGDVVQLSLPMPVERIQADPRVTADLGRVALQRGPIVYCLEGVDNGGKVRNLALPREVKLTAEHRPDLLSGVTVVRGEGLVAETSPDEGWEQALYQPAPAAGTVPFTAIPYYVWDNRQPGEMMVWLPESLTLLERPPIGWIKQASASHSPAGGVLEALYDRLEPSDSHDQKIPRFTWWPQVGSVEWVQYDFTAPRQVSRTKVYWFNDTPQNGRCRPPASWKLLYRDGESWKEVVSASGYGVEVNQYNVAGFEPVTTTGLRIEVQLRDKFSGGILEWQAGAR